MSVLDGLNFIKVSNPRILDPVVAGRETFTRNLRNQVAMLKGSQLQGKPWWTERCNDILATIRFSNKPIEVNGGDRFTVQSKEPLIEVYQNLIREAENGDLDALLKKHASTLKSSSPKVVNAA